MAAPQKEPARTNPMEPQKTKRRGSFFGNVVQQNKSSSTGGNGNKGIAVLSRFHSSASVKAPQRQRRRSSLSHVAVATTPDVEQIPVRKQGFVGSLLGRAEFLQKERKQRPRRASMGLGGPAPGSKRRLVSDRSPSVKSLGKLAKARPASARMITETAAGEPVIKDRRAPSSSESLSREGSTRSTSQRGSGRSSRSGASNRTGSQRSLQKSQSKRLVRKVPIENPKALASPTKTSPKRRPINPNHQQKRSDNKQVTRSPQRSPMRPQQLRQRRRSSIAHIPQTEMPNEGTVKALIHHHETGSNTVPILPPTLRSLQREKGSVRRVVKKTTIIRRAKVDPNHDEKKKTTSPRPKRRASIGVTAVPEERVGQKAVRRSSLGQQSPQRQENDETSSPRRDSPQTPKRSIAEQPSPLSSPQTGIQRIPFLPSQSPPESMHSRATLSTFAPQRAAHMPKRVSRRASLQHVPQADDPVVQPPGEPYIVSPRRQMTAKAQILAPETPSTKRNFVDPGIQVHPETPGLHFSPMKRQERQLNAADIVDNIRNSGLFEGEEEASKNTRLYEYARLCEWDRASEECQLFPRDAKCVDEVDGTTALHLAIMSRANPAMRDGRMGDMQPAPIQLIEQLVVACPEAAIIRCTAKRYTPLTYACLVLDTEYNMADSASVVNILLHHAPHSAYVFTDDGFSALDVHILSYSRFHKGMLQEVGPIDQRSTLVLETLLRYRPDLAEARSYKNRVRGPVELLYRSNLAEFKTLSEDTTSALTTTWWAWLWVCLLLKHAPRPGEKANLCCETSFKVVHAAASLVGCPIPVLSLAASAFPTQLIEADHTSSVGNLPLHEVCSWICDQETLNGDPFVLRRKSMAVECLLGLYPEAAKCTNNMHETPLQLAIESNTPWDCGLRALVDFNPDALMVPRKLRPCTDFNDLRLSVDIYDDNESVGSDWVDPLEPVDGMHPFLVAAVVAHVSDSKLKGPTFMFNDQPPELHQLELDKKNVESLNSIYGLLRAKPEAFTLYKPETKVTNEESYDSDCSEYTEETLDE